MRIKKRRIFYFLAAITLALLIVACQIVVTISTDGRIDFHTGVYDINYSKLSMVQDHIFFMGGWGKKGSAQDMAGYRFLLRSNYFDIANVTLSDGYDRYEDIWNYIPLEPDASGVKTSVLDTDCILTYNYHQVNFSNNTANGKYRCRIICYSKPEPGGKMHHTVQITVYTQPWSNNDLDQLNIEVKGIGGVSVNYL